MKIFFDMEFQERIALPIMPISFGLVREDGAELYREMHFSEEACSPWVKENVLRHLIVDPIDRKMLPFEAAKLLIEFCGEAPEFWADYASYDWVVLCGLFGTMMDLPKGWPMFVHDFQQHLDDLPIFEFKDEPENLTMADNRKILQEDGPQQDPATLHHALHDARHLKAQYDFIQSRL